MSYLEAVKRVAALMQQRFYIAMRAGSVHEDERPLSGRERGAVAAGSLVLPTVEVQQRAVHHDLEVVAQPPVDLVEHSSGTFNQLCRSLEGAESILAVFVHVEVPRSQAVESQGLPPAMPQPLGRGNDHLGDTVLKRD